MERFFNAVQKLTERFLLWRKRRRFIKSEKQKKKNFILDWLEAFLWAAGVVFLINQYLFQAYEIPSGSMSDTLLIKDRIFVNKFIYGPELLPGVVKLPGLTEPKRDEVIIFESPAYISKGPIFDILQRIIYMLTLSLVNLDRGKSGEEKAHFLIKRAIGIDGDRIRFNKINGEMEIRPWGEIQWRTGENFEKFNPPLYKIRRILDQKDYQTIKEVGISEAYQYSRLTSPKEASKAAEDLPAYYDRPVLAYWWNKTLFEINPQNRKYAGEWRKGEMGWYIPAGYIFPMGDNRDNSVDARVWGYVRKEKILGRAAFKYWPISRIGGLE
ncbi:MAG: signal peptidase I [Spirochaetota bacterium]